MKLFTNLGVDPLQKDKLNQTSLYYAARENKIQCCKLLVEFGVPLNERDIYMQTPIYYAAREGNTEIIDYLVSKGADINLEDKYGQIPLHYAIKNGHDESVELLLKLGSSINKVDKKKQTLYIYALKNNRPSIAEILVKYGASVEAHDSKKMLSKKKVRTDEPIEVENRYKNFVLIKFTEDGKTMLSLDELNRFSQDYSEIYSLLNNKYELEKIEKEADERLRDTEGWEKVCKKVINQLWKVKDAIIFLKPVDPIELNIPDYFTIIKNPMDFSTIKKRLNAGLYTNFKEFNDDMNLVFNNCFLYNGEKSYVGSMCMKVKVEYDRLYSQNNLDLFL